MGTVYQVISHTLHLLIMSLKNQIFAALRTVQDPDLKQDVVTLGMIQDLHIDARQVTFSLVLTTPACPWQAFLKKTCVDVVRTQVAMDLTVTVRLTSQVTSSKKDTAVLPHVKNIIAIASGKGGVGKSTVAVNMAIVLAQYGARVGLLDADIFGPSIPIMLGCEQDRPRVLQQAGKPCLIPLEKYGIKFLSIGVLSPPDEAILWRGPMASKALKQLIGDTDWGALDYLLVDLPPGTSDIHLTLVQTVPVTGAVIVTTPQKVALMDARKGGALFQKPGIDVPILGIVENMAYFLAEASSDNRHYLFGKGGGQALAMQYQVPLLGQIPLMQSIREGGDMGHPFASQVSSPVFEQVVTAMAQQVAISNAQ